MCYEFIKSFKYFYKIPLKEYFCYEIKTEGGKNAQIAMVGMLADLPLEDPAEDTALVCKLMQ